MVVIFVYLSYSIMLQYLIENCWCGLWDIGLHKFRPVQVQIVCLPQNMIFLAKLTGVYQIDSYLFIAVHRASLS